VSTHGNTACARVQQGQKAGQRRLAINPATFAAEHGRLASAAYDFGSTAAVNDMWLEIDFGDRDFELAIVAFIQRLLGARYAPLGRAQIERHCE